MDLVYSDGIELLFQSELGGRVTIFQCSLPSIGPGTLKSREDPNKRAAGVCEFIYIKYIWKAR